MKNLLLFFELKAFVAEDILLKYDPYMCIYV